MKKLGRPREYSRNRVCSYCRKDFEGYPGKPKGKNTFCGNPCRLKWLGEQNLSKRVNQKGGMTLEERKKLRKTKLNTGEGKSYEKCHGVHLHRLVAEAKMGRLLRDGEVVHHIDGDHRNNEPDNLHVFATQSDHMKWHIENDPKYARGGG